MVKIDLDTLYEYLDRPKRYSNYIAAICPFHLDTSPSLLVFEDGYHCQSCGAHGSLEYLYNKISGRPIIRVKQKISSASFIWKNWIQKFDTVENICRIAHDYTVSNPSKYFRSRKIDSVVQSCYLGYLDDFYVFPIKDRNNKILGATARASPTSQTKENRWSVSPDCHALFVPSWKQILASDYLVVVFGIFDSIGLSICGFPAVTGVTGASFDPTLLDEFGRPIYVIPDLHEERQGLELVSKLGWRGIPIFLDYPEHCKDCADIREKFDDEKLIALTKEKMNGAKVVG